jgi:hypothetical protein
MRFPVFILFFMIPLFGRAQSPYVLRYTVENHTLDRYDILQKSDTFLCFSLNNPDAKMSSSFLMDVWKRQDLTTKDRYNLEHYFKQYVEFLPVSLENKPTSSGFFENNYTENPVVPVMDKSYFTPKPVGKYFYRTPAHFLHLETPSFQLYINPVFQFLYTHETGNDNIVFQNTRGAEIKGYIDEKVYFFAHILENQRSFPSFVEEGIQTYRAIPGQGFSKGFNSSVIKNLKGYDYFNARTYIGFNPVKSMQLELGHGNHFIGNGYRSLLLSDFSAPYFYFKINTRVWKFHYQNLFKELSPISTLVYRGGDNILPKKYAATHYLAFRPNQHVEIGLFETVVFERPNHFEFQYLNPIILYRAVEHSLGSPDNILLGLNLKWNFLKRFSLYGQIIADEFKFNEIINNTGWWANKFGGQIGLKYINAFNIDQLDIQVEYNVVRPYTYSHRDTLDFFPEFSSASYSTHNQPLAHPLGANFKEFVALIRYKPTNRLYTQARILSTLTGRDGPDENNGQNIFKPYTILPQLYGNTIGQGVRNQIFSLHFDVSYEFYHNTFIDLRYQFRQEKLTSDKQNSLFSLGIRMNMQDIQIDY